MTVDIIKTGDRSKRPSRNPFPKLYSIIKPRIPNKLKMSKTIKMYISVTGVALNA